MATDPEQPSGRRGAARPALPVDHRELCFPMIVIMYPGAR